MHRHTLAVGLLAAAALTVGGSAAAHATTSGPVAGPGGPDLRDVVCRELPPDAAPVPPGDHEIVVDGPGGPIDVEPADAAAPAPGGRRVVRALEPGVLPNSCSAAVPSVAE